MDRKLIDYLPPAVAEIRDYQALHASVQVETDRLWSALETNFNNKFIESANEAGIARFEGICGAAYKATDTLDIRRFRVHTRFNEQPPFTRLKLLEQLKALCGEEGVKVEFDGNKVTVKVELTAKEKVDEVKELLERTAPATSTIEVLLLYNPWVRLINFTWSEASVKTWNEARNGVL